MFRRTVVSPFGILSGDVTSTVHNFGSPEHCTVDRHGSRRFKILLILMSISSTWTVYAALGTSVVGVNAKYMDRQVDNRLKMDKNWNYNSSIITSPNISSPQYRKGNCSEALPFYLLTHLPAKSTATILHVSIPGRAGNGDLLKACDFCLRYISHAISMNPLLSFRELERCWPQEKDIKERWIRVREINAKHIPQGIERKGKEKLRNI